MAGLPKPQLYVVDDPALNVFVTGRDPKHAAVAVTAVCSRPSTGSSSRASSRASSHT